MDGPVLYSIKRLLRILDSRWAHKTRKVQFRGISFEFYVTYWWSDVSQTLLETEIAPYFDVLENDFNPSVIIDVGAATGHFAILAAKLFPGSTVYAFEPSKRQRILLARNAERNGVNLEIEPFGLWNRADRLPFRTNGAESSFESVSRFRGQLRFLEKVPVLSLDKWTQEKRLTHVELVKMDAEGAELEILEGASETLRLLRPRLLIQAYHQRNGVRTFERCADLLAHQGYRIQEPAPNSGLLYAN
jgi:FkbM family methyltransferase